MDLTAQVLCDDVGSQRKIWCVGAVHALAPVSANGRHPTGSAVTAVLPTESVNIRATTKQIEVEADLVVGRRRHIDRRLRRPGQGRLIGIGSSGLRFAQLQ